MTARKMKVQGVEITPEQRSAGIAAMVGVFLGYNVRRALLEAGVPTEIRASRITQKPAEKWFVWEVANRILQAERKSGRVKYLGKTAKGALWESLL